MLLAAALGSTFNLACSGAAYHVDKLLGPQKDVHQFEVVYRLDLATERYCQSACTVTSKIAEVTDTLIIFEKEQTDEIDDVVVYANRESGRYVNRRRWYDGKDMEVDLAEGSCHRIPFSGFPKRQF